MKIMFAVSSAWDSYSPPFSLGVFETEKMAEEFIVRHRQKYIEEYGVKDTDLMWVSEMKIMDSVEEALEILS